MQLQQVANVPEKIGALRPSSFRLDRLEIGGSQGHESKVTERGKLSGQDVGNSKWHPCTEQRLATNIQRRVFIGRAMVSRAYVANFKTSC